MQGSPPLSPAGLAPLGQCLTRSLQGPARLGLVLHPMAQSMSELVGDDAAFRRHVFEVIEGQRLKLKLPPFDRARLM